MSKMVLYASDQAHVSAWRAAKLAGLKVPIFELVS